jgi:hypothetical protein
MAKTIDKAKLQGVVNKLDPANDDHWNQAGGPDMNHIKEAAGTAISRKLMAEHGFADLNRENVHLFYGAHPPAEPEAGPGNERDERGPDEPFNIHDGEDPEPEEEASPEPEPLNLFVSLDTGEPTISNEELLELLKNPGTLTAEQGGAVIIKTLDVCGLVLTQDVRRRQSELGEVIQLYQANRPSIIGRQKRLAQRQSQIHKAANG